MVDYDGPAVCQGFDRMRNTAGHDCHHVGFDNPGHAINGDFKLALDHFIDLFLRMKMFMDGSASHKIVVREGHAGRMEIASMPARQTLNCTETADIHKWHRDFSQAHRSTVHEGKMLVSTCIYARGKAQLTAIELRKSGS